MSRELQRQQSLGTLTKCMEKVYCTVCVCVGGGDLII